MDWLILGLLLLVFVMILIDPTYLQLQSLRIRQAQMEAEYREFKTSVLKVIDILNAGYVEHGQKVVECLQGLDKRIKEIERKGCVRT